MNTLLKSTGEWMIALVLLTPMLAFNLWWAGVDISGTHTYWLLTLLAGVMVLFKLLVAGQWLTGLILGLVTALTLFMPTVPGMVLLLIALVAGFKIR